jgi:hypothetical protein
MPAPTQDELWIGKLSSRELLFGLQICWRNQHQEVCTLVKIQEVEEASTNAPMLRAEVSIVSRAQRLEKMAPHHQMQSGVKRCIPVGVSVAVWVVAGALVARIVRRNQDVSQIPDRET